LKGCDIISSLINCLSAALQGMLTSMKFNNQVFQVHHYCAFILQVPWGKANWKIIFRFSFYTLLCWLVWIFISN